MNLPDRLRGILDAARGSAERARPNGTPPAEASGTLPTATLDEILGGEWRQPHGRDARCFVVERHMPPTTVYGDASIGEMASRLAAAAMHAPLLTPAQDARPPFLFFDIETTGLSGGAGTCAFLIGCAWFGDDGAFVTRQYMLARHHDERPMLEVVGDELARAGALVTFNGKSFDAPVVEMRCLFHRLEWTGGRLPHLDVLHPARAFWGGTPAPLASGDRSSCSLVALEQKVLGIGRNGDVPGFEIPARYFQFLRAGDARPLAAVFEHNRLDLLTLAGLTVRLLQLLAEGSDTARDAYEALALGRVFQRAGLDPRAGEAFERAVAMSRSMEASQGAPILADALRSLALAARRGRRYDDAAQRWRQLLDIPGCPRSAAREALEALAIHHEHRRRDLGVAHTFALESLKASSRTAGERARHRLARLERKLSDVKSKRADSTSALFTI